MTKKEAIENSDCFKRELRLISCRVELIKDLGYTPQYFIDYPDYLLQINEYISRDNLNIYLGYNIVLKPLQFLIDKFYNRGTKPKRFIPFRKWSLYLRITDSSSLEELGIVNLNQINDQQFYLSGIKSWKRIKPELDKLLNQYLDYNFLYEKSQSEKVFVSSFFSKLVLSKIIGEEEYKLTLSKLTPTINQESKTRKDIQAKADIQSLIDYLETLDIEKFLREKPWIKYCNDYYAEQRIDISGIQEPDTIYIERTSMFASSRIIEIEEYKEILGVADIDLKDSNHELSDVMKMTFEQGNEISILADDPAIAFLQSPYIYELFDMEKASDNGEALRFVIDNGVADSVRIDYWKNGKILLDYTYSLGELDQKTHPDFDLHDNDSEMMIAAIFKRITRRNLFELKQSEKVLKFSFSS